MKLVADLHTHSKHSRFFHGKNSIIEMVYHANELGLKEIAITDHAFKHICRTSKDKLYDARLTIDDLNKWSKTKVLLGIEADILDENGTLDIDAETLALIDILVVGYHKMIKTDLANFFGKQEDTEAAKQKATNAFINAINRYPVTIVSHLDSILTTDLYEVGRACAQKGVFVEINNRHTDWNEDQVNDLLASGCMFVVSSDAHCREDVGEVSNALNLIQKFDIPSERIINVEFDYDEMTEEHKEINLLYDEIKRKQGKVEKEVKRKEEERETMSHLSKEMEDELEKIASEQGYNYSRPVSAEPDIQSEEKDVQISRTDEENTARFLNAIDNIANIFEETPEENEVNVPELDDEVIQTENTEPKVDSKEETEEELNTEPETQEANLVEETISEDVPVVIKNISKKKPATKEVNKNEKPSKAEEKKTEELINMFSVNASQKASKSSKNANGGEGEKPKKRTPKNIKPGAFVDISSLTDGEGDKK